MACASCALNEYGVVKNPISWACLIIVTSTLHTPPTLYCKRTPLISQCYSAISTEWSMQRTNGFFDRDSKTISPKSPQSKNTKREQRSLYP
jgi:hypothetical protein